MLTKEECNVFSGSPCHLALHCQRSLGSTERLFCAKLGSHQSHRVCLAGKPGLVMWSLVLFFIRQACQHWHPTSMRAHLSLTASQIHTDTLMESFIRPFITEEAESQCSTSHSNPQFCCCPLRPQMSRIGAQLNEAPDWVSFNISWSTKVNESK